MSLERVKEFFASKGENIRILEFAESSATVELAAQAVGCEPARIAKTLSFLVTGRPVLVVAAGDARVDNAKFRAFFQEKARMIPSDQVESYIGHAPGGVCPFACREGTEVYLDISLRRFDSVYPAAGSSNSAVLLTLEELERYSASRAWVDVCKLRTAE